jgi:NADPH:quinone reductase
MHDSLPASMRAWRVHEFGEPHDVLRLDTVERPEPGDGEVLLEVTAVALNLPDVLTCRGDYQVRPPLPFVPGAEMAGTVAAVGEGVAGGLAVGDRVSAIARLPAGALAGYTTLRVDEVFPIPDTLGDVDAAALNGTYQTAWYALHRRAAISPGEVLLVHAGTSGVGIASIQLGVAAGARVIATAGGDEKRKVCEALGAERGIDYNAEDFAEVVNDLTDGRGADVIVDPVGGDVFDRSRKCIAFEGRIVVVGFAGGRIAVLKANHPLLKNYAVVGLNFGHYRTRDRAGVAACHDELVRLHGEGRAAPLVGAELPFERVPEAMSSLLERSRIGRIVVRGANALTA